MVKVGSTTGSFCCPTSIRTTRSGSEIEAGPVSGIEGIGTDMREPDKTVRVQVGMAGALVLLMLLAACGGGESDSSEVSTGGSGGAR